MAWDFSNDAAFGLSPPECGRSCAIRSSRLTSSSPGPEVYFWEQICLWTTEAKAAQGSHLETSPVAMSLRGNNNRLLNGLQFVVEKMTPIRHCHAG
jgi:hypothetical protein